LGLPPLPGSSSGVGLAEQTTPPPVLISSGKATQEIAAAGSLMLSSDRAYAEARRQLRAAPGGARMPGSTWVPDPVEWGPGFVATMVDELSSSPGLLPNTDVKLVAVRLDPSVVPPSGGSGSGIQVVSPTKSLGVTMVVQNTGNVIAAHVTATATLQPASGGPSKTVKTVVSLFPGGTAALPLRRLQVSPGATYQLNLSITPPPSQVDQSALTLQPMTIQVAGSSVIDMKLASLSVRPSPEPRRTGTLAGSLLVPTTTSLQATAEILNAGNVAVHGVPVTASLEEVDVQVAPQTQSKLVSVQAGAQLNAAFPSFLVQPGATYVLSVSIALPPGQIDETALSLQETISVSPTTRHGPAAP